MTLEEKLKNIITEGLKLEDVKPEDVTEDSPLFGEGLGLDSLDAVELVVLIKKNFSVEIKDMEEAKAAFKSIKALADYIRAHQGK